jgi:hypothetical protein
MNSHEWDAHGYQKRINPSGEVIRVKQYNRTLIAWDNQDTRSLVAKRKQLAKLLGVPDYDLLADLKITIDIERYPRHRRFLNYIPNRGKLTGGIEHKHKNDDGSTSTHNHINGNKPHGHHGSKYCKS